MYAYALLTDHQPCYSMFSATDHDHLIETNRVFFICRNNPGQQSTTSHSDLAAVTFLTPYPHTSKYRATR